ncbi:MAG TPA: beta-galactosidase, partial [Phycisphaerae bacterium]|nr:beta-galactosidase [Phycisphaerae bacterium]
MTAQNTRPAAVLMTLGLPGESRQLIEALSQEINAAGFETTAIDCANFMQTASAKGRAFDLLVLPDAAHLPTSLASIIEKYARQGGHILSLQAPIWHRPTVRTPAGWVERSTHLRARAADLPPYVIFRFEPDAVRDWQISRTPDDRDTSHETVADGPGPGQRSLHIVGRRLNGYDVHFPKFIDKPFPAGHALTVFSARGAPGTDQMSVEWEEADGSRWIAVVELGPKWSQYVLFPEDFRYWESVRSRSNDRFRPENARVIRFGVSLSHTPGLAGKPYEFWVGPVGTAPDDAEHEQLRSGQAVSAMDTLCPTYKLFDCHGVARIATRDDQILVSAAEFDVPTIVRSPHPRARGAGFDKRRSWRWIPLVEARTLDGQWRGTPVTLLVHTDGPFKGGAWASAGIEGAEWYLKPAARRLIREMASSMARGVFILDGGSDHFTYFADQPLRLGVQAATLREQSDICLTACVRVTDRDTNKTAFEHTWPLQLSGGTPQKVEISWKPDGRPAGGFTCTAELLDGGRIIDRVSHEIHVWQPKSDKRFVTVADGHFQLDGQPWRAHGVNYMPTSGTAAEDYKYFNDFLSARSYDPEVVARDLANVRDIGFNAISTFLLHPSTRDQNLMDLLRQADRAGLKVNLALCPTTPMDFQADKIREMIEFHRLSEHDEVFAVDIDWEPMFGPQEHRARWDREWEAWIVERYGSMAAAEQDWGCKVPRTPAGAITNPPADQIDTDGPHRVMVAAYRRFLDTLIYQRYSAARRFIRAIDPNHMVSFRMSNAGDPTYRHQGWLAYDYPYLAAAVDFLAPEAYGRVGDWERVKPGWFEVAYARWATPDKPVLWAEAGVSAWDAGRMQSTPAALQFQADFHEQFYKMLIASRSDGIFWWYYPGGFRPYENSDYGLINPDGSDRPVTHVIRKYGPLLLAAPLPKPADRSIEIDRDAKATGLFGIHESVQQQFWKA